MSEHLLLKWGSLKGWNVESDAAKAALNRWFDGGVSASAMCQRDTVAQKQALCDLIDAVDGEIHNDWSGETMSKVEAKQYILDYGRDR